MIKKAFSIITFVFSVLVLIALGILTYDMIKEYNYINSLPTTSGSDYFGFLFYRMFYCITALPGIIASVICLKISTIKPIKTVSSVLLAAFIIIAVVSGISWLGLA